MRPDGRGHLGRLVAVLAPALLLVACPSSPRSTAVAADSAPGLGDSSAAGSTADGLPRTCNEAIAYIFEHMTPDLRNKVRATPKGEVAATFMGTWGLSIRNDLRLGAANRAVLASCAAWVHGPAEPEPVSATIMIRAWDRLQVEPHD
jgi:hypothetical protein